jgi:hypothetical protein
MSATGIRFREILTLRQGNPNHNAILRTVHNVRHRICRENLKVRTPIQALFGTLKERYFERIDISTPHF